MFKKFLEKVWKPGIRRAYLAQKLYVSLSIYGIRRIWRIRIFRKTSDTLSQISRNPPGQNFTNLAEAKASCQGPDITFNIATQRSYRVNVEQKMEKSCNKRCNTTDLIGQILQTKDPFYILFDGDFNANGRNLSYNGVYRKINQDKVIRIIKNTAGRTVYK